MADPVRARDDNAALTQAHDAPCPDKI